MSPTLNTTTTADGFRMPGEFEPHAGCWMLWPERTDNWRLGAKPAQAAFVAVATAIGVSEPVTVGVSGGQFRNARACLPPGVRVVELSFDDAWMRDVGPSFVIGPNGRLRGVDWRFNAWGGLDGGFYFPWNQDDLVARKVLEIERADRYQAPLVLEGGAIHVDGEGTIITTAECVMNPNRNPGVDRPTLEGYLQAYLGASVVIWLEKGLPDDETGGHVDNLCAFIRPGEVVLAWADDPNDPLHTVSRDAFDALTRAKDARGRKLTIHKLIQPEPMHLREVDLQGVDRAGGILPRTPGTRLAASYVNFYISNSAVVMPYFNTARDQIAHDTLSKLFSTRRVVGVDAREILFGGGGVHCITQQVPRYVHQKTSKGEVTKITPRAVRQIISAPTA